MAFPVSGPRKQIEIDVEMEPQANRARVAPGRTKQLTDRAADLGRRSYFLRCRSQGIAGWAILHRREAVSLHTRKMTDTNQAKHKKSAGK